ncbi:rab-GTPase-TBC domain-containing protein [Gloeopeniophorella convolvens]|nr:rab-GTPase-TBC domain-containing protein [Gloeopeniophorella convolvens]
MHSGHDWATDSEQVVVPESVHKSPPPLAPFYLDDAFEDVDDVDASFEFSSAAIRAELARSASSPHEDVSGNVDKPRFVSAADSAGIIHQGPSPDVSTPSLDDGQLDAQFDSVSLSGSPVDRISKHGLHHDDTSSEHEVATERRDYGHSKDDSVSSTGYHGVYIDASESHPVAVEAHLETPPPTPPPRLSSDASTSDSREASATPPEQYISPKAVSSPSLPIPPTPASSTAPDPPRPSTSYKVHKPTKSSGPSTFEKVVSKTRPSFLPPKSRTEDQKHMADWEKMMKKSRAAEEKRRKALQERRLARELRVEQSLHVWEKEILPDWKVVHRNPAMRKLWWAGIPTKLRATMWERAVGNALALSKDTYRICLARAKRSLAAGTFPTTSLSLIEEDVATTLPSIHIFHPDTGPMYEDLKEMLYAWIVSRSDEGLGYVNGTAKIAAMILLNMPAAPGFIVMKNLLERHCMRSFYGGLSTKDDVEAYYRIFDTLLADGMPKIYFNFKQHQISPAAYLPDWILPLFLDHLPFEACARVWDVLLLEGDSFLYRASLAILAVLEPRLFFPDRKELIELLRGENKAALEVARRDGRPPNGGKYEIYGLDEETLWDRIDSMNDWWKESTWTRLLQRELPDV